jgi:hypothetical protein
MARKKQATTAPENDMAALIFGAGGEDLRQASSLSEITNELKRAGDDVVKGDTAYAERMLLSQARALQLMFSRVFEMGMKEAQFLDIKEAGQIFSIALKAQNQSRMTLETLSVIKNPPVLFVKQTNISAGHQQVNNGLHAHAEEEKKFNGRMTRIKNPQNQLSGTVYELLPDARAQGETISIDTPMEAVGEINGAKVRRG